MRRTINLAILTGLIIALTLAAQTDAAAQQLLLNEVEIDPPSTTSNACQYAEVRGTAGTTVPANTYFLSVNSDGANFGFANQAVNFGGQVVGANGTITLFNNASLACPNRTYPAQTTFLSYSSPLTVGTGSETYLVVRSTATLFSGQDLDADDDGAFDAGLGITVLDGFGLIVNPEEEFVYGSAAGVVNISNTTSVDQPDAVTRFSNNTTPFVVGAFYFGELAASPDETTEYAAPLSSNFPAGGALTPGGANLPSTAAPEKATVDFDGDGRTDFSVTRNVDGLLNWFTAINGTSETRFVQWGLPGDVPAPEDFDGDGKDDLAVWRAGNPFEAGFYILQSSNNTLKLEIFGQTGDNPRVVGDWDGDGKADPAVYRDSAAPGQSFFYYRASNNNPNGDITYVPWGAAGDKPVRGDFDGDGKADAAVFRASNSVWYIRRSSDLQIRYDYFGVSSARFVAADYDGDDKTDLAVFRSGVWWIRQSSDNAVSVQNWGLATDVPIPGDYNGDGRSDLAVWRDGTLYITPTGGGNTIITNWGLTGDFPVANIYTE
jgi:hypothetical protein